MSAYRPILVELLKRVIAGGDITREELMSAIPREGALETQGAERKAYYGLSYWSDDDDIRAKDPHYGPFRREQLQQLLSALNEIET